MLVLSEKNILLQLFKSNIKESPSEKKSLIKSFQIFNYEPSQVADGIIVQSREGSGCSHSPSLTLWEEARQ